MPADTPPPADAPQPTVRDTAAASTEQVAASARLLEQAEALARMAAIPEVMELADTWEKRLATQQAQFMRAVVAILLGKDVASDLAVEGRRATQAATTSTIVMRGAWALLALVGMVGGGWGVNVALDAAERRAQIEEKASARAAEALDSGKPEGPRLPPGGGGPPTTVLETGDAGAPSEGVARPDEGP